jgi:hypothetical protein
LEFDNGKWLMEDTKDGKRKRWKVENGECKRWQYSVTTGESARSLTSVIFILHIPSVIQEKDPGSPLVRRRCPLLDPGGSTPLWEKVIAGRRRIM